MSYTQVVKFYKSKGGTKKGWCLQNVRLGYGIGPKYSNAWQAWLGSEKRTTTPPKGVAVPIYFSWVGTIDGVRKNYGHIGVQLPDGKFWSDGKIYTSYKTYDKANRPTYVGWAESVNGVKVVKKNVEIDWKKKYTETAKQRDKAYKDLKKCQNNNVILQLDISKLKAERADLSQELANCNTMLTNTENELKKALKKLVECKNEWTWGNVIKWIAEKLKLRRTQ